MKLLLLVLPLFGFINAQNTNFYENLTKFKQEYYAKSCLQHEGTRECRQINSRAQKAIKNNCFNHHVKMGYENNEDCLDKLTNMFKYNLQIQRPNTPQKSVNRRAQNTIRRPNQHHHPRVQSDELALINYDDYNAVLNAEDDKKITEMKSDEIKSSEEENYDDDFWRKKDSRETLLKDINSVEKEVGVEQTGGSFKRPEIREPLQVQQYGHIASELIEKHKWLNTINPRVFVYNNKEIHFHPPKLSDNLYYFFDLILTPIPNGPGHVIFSSSGEIHVNFLQGKTSCGLVGYEKRQYACIKPLDLHIRVRPDTPDNHYDWDLVCMQVYLPAWKYGYEFCYQINRNNDLLIFDQNENHYFRQMRLFVFNGGTYDNWEPHFINMYNN